MRLPKTPANVTPVPATMLTRCSEAPKSRPNPPRVLERAKEATGITKRSTVHRTVRLRSSAITSKKKCRKLSLASRLSAGGAGRAMNNGNGANSKRLKSPAPSAIGNRRSRNIAKIAVMPPVPRLAAVNQAASRFLSSTRTRFPSHPPMAAAARLHRQRLQDEQECEPAEMMDCQQRRELHKRREQNERDCIEAARETPV